MMGEQMYNYETEKPKLFTDEGQRMFLKIRDRAQYLIREAGAFRETEVLKDSCGESWTMLACIDRMLELGEIRRASNAGWRQYWIYSSPETHNR